MRLRGVSDDEHEEVIRLLEEHQINYYETDAGNWGISMPAIWLKDREQLSLAKQLLDSYQQQRTQRIQEEYATQKRAGHTANMVDRFIEAPLPFVIYLLTIIFILYISLYPFFSNP